MFWNNSRNILEINVFQNKKQGLCKKCGYFIKMADIGNNKLMGLWIIAGGVLLLSHEHIKERRKRRQCARPWIRKGDSKCSLYI